jgi:TetR/AcrR family transcriptional regulator, transcriptional repressor for nem operon
MIGNFVEFRSEVVPGGCPLMNTAVRPTMEMQFCAHAPKRLCKAGWVASPKLPQTVSGENQIYRRMDPQKLSQLIIGTLEGALLTSRLKKDRQALHDAREHFDDYPERSVRAKTSRK